MAWWRQELQAWACLTGRINGKRVRLFCSKEKQELDILTAAWVDLETMVLSEKFKKQNNTMPLK